MQFIDVMMLRTRIRVIEDIVLITIKQYIIYIGILIALLGGESYASIYTVKQQSYSKYTVLDPAKIWKKTNRNVSDIPQKILSFVSFRYRMMMNPKSEIASEVTSSSEEVLLVSRPLVYPNPFRLTNNSIKDAEIGYELTDNGDIEIRIYDFRAYEVYNKIFDAGTLGGTVGYNRIPLSKSEFDYVDMPSGIYVFLIIHSQKVIGKGKFVIKP